MQFGKAKIAQGNGAEKLVADSATNDFIHNIKTEPAKRGRKKQSETRNNSVVLYVTEGEKAQIEQWANAHGTPTSALIKSIVFKAIRDFNERQ